MLVGLLSVGAELVAIIACTVAINKLSEIKRAVTSRLTRGPRSTASGTGGVPTGWSVLRQLPPRTTRRGGCHKA